MANYDAALWRIFDGMQPKASVPPIEDLQLTAPYGRTGRKGRPYSHTAKEFGQFLKAIAEINSANPRLVSNDGIARVLKTRPLYQRLSQRQLRRKVATAIDWETRLLKFAPHEIWKKVFGLDPPRRITNKSLREKAFEYLRYELKRHNQRQA
jgi:hypothetical protein